MPKLLEVIVTSVDEALEAQAGNADRLELVRALDHGGLTPALDTIESVLIHTRIPVRIMLRENSTMSVLSAQEMKSMEMVARALSKLPVDGLVAGFAENGEIDKVSLHKLAGAAPSLPVTFHRAFETLKDPERQIETLKSFGFVDRILLRSTGRFSLPYLVRLQALAAPQIRFITGPGLDCSALAELAQCPTLQEVHVGRAAREPAAVEGRVSRTRIAAVREMLS